MLSLYSVVIPAFRQTLPQVSHLIDKAEAHCVAAGLPADTLIQARLAPDMLPFAFQVKSAAVHSLGAIEGVRAGVFSPDMVPPPDSFAGLRDRIGAARTAIEAIVPEELDGFTGQDMSFRMSERRMEFTAEDFLLSFSLPNFYFHVTTAYAILRANGVAIGKLDYIGRPRVKA